MNRAKSRAKRAPGRRRPTAKAPTILDVAAAAGVSKSTVSNVVRGAEEVSMTTRNRVLDAIDRLGYQPNAIAREFVKQRTTILGVLAGDLGNPYYGCLAQTAERAAFGSGYTTMLCNIEDPNDGALSRVRALLEHRVAGMLLVASAARTQELDDALRRAGVPVVLLGSGEEWGDCVGPQDAQAGRIATEHLISLGHRRIAYVRAPGVAESTDRARHGGYRSAMRAVGLSALAPFHWQPGSSSIRTARHDLELTSVLRRSEESPTALLLSTDVAAIAMLEQCEAAGHRVPRDVSIVSFDDVAAARLRRLSLTTVAGSLEQLAEQAVELLLERIDNPGLPQRNVSIPVELHVRHSTAAPVK